MKNHTYLTYLKIIVCCLIFFFVPALTEILSGIAESRTISLTLVVSTAAMLLIFTNHQLAGLHWKRFIASYKEHSVYILFSALFVWAVCYLSQRFFSFQIETIDPLILKSYPFFAPLIVITYTFSYAFCFNIVFKLLTDKIHLKVEPQTTILVSGMLLGLFLTVSQFAVLPALAGQFDSLLFAKGFVVNFLLSLCTSYCYNQTSTVVPMTLGFTAAMLLIFLF